MSYKVKLDIFEGPFDLLVYLIERAGVNIYDVNISEITDQYLAYVDVMEQIDPDTAAEFMVLAATLLQIKSRMLLPAEKTDKGTVIEEDPRDELAKKIVEYKKYKYIAEVLRICEERGSRIYTKPREDISVYMGEPEEYLNVDMNKFIKAFRLFLEKRRRVEEVKKRYEQVAREKMSMERKSQQVSGLLRKRKRLSFGELLADEIDTYDIVLTFVTLLEMLAKSMITVNQPVVFGDIEVMLKEDLQNELH